MTSRRAACTCGQLSITVDGDPARISMCHCLECQRRTGGVLSNQARFRREQVTEIGGRATEYTRGADSGNTLTFRFCPVCGSTVYWEGQGFPGFVAIAIGTFADPDFPAPTLSIWENARHRWVDLASDPPITRKDGPG